MPSAERAPSRWGGAFESGLDVAVLKIMSAPSPALRPRRPSLPSPQETPAPSRSLADAPQTTPPAATHARATSPSPFRSERGRSVPAGRTARLPSSDPAARRQALETAREALDDSGWFGDVSAQEAKSAADAIAGLGPDDAASVVRTLQREGLFAKLAVALEEHADSAEGQKTKNRFGEAMARGLDGETLAGVGESMRMLGEPFREGFERGLRTASVDRKLDFIAASARRTTDQTPTRGSRDAGVGHFSSTTYLADGDAVSAAAVIASLRGEDVQTALALLSPEQTARVFQAAANPRRTYTTATVRVPAPVAAPAPALSTVSGDPARFRELLEAGASIPDPHARRAALDAGLSALGALPPNLSREDRAEMASAALRHIDGPTLERLAPDGVGNLAAALARAPAGPLAALRRIESLPASPAREALVRTLFLKTPPRALETSETRTRFARALAAGPKGEALERAQPRARALERALSSEAGRSLLADPSVSSGARLWAAREVMAGSSAARRALASDAPWESRELLQAHAKGRLYQHEVRGDRAVQVSGRNIENLVGAGLGAPLRADLPKTEGGLADAQARALDGKYNFYEGVEAVSKVAEGIREAQTRMGGGAIAVATLPLQFSSEDTGPIDLKLYRVEGARGQSRFVDNVGRVYDSFDAWKKDNKLPPGKMTYPEAGHLGEPGQTQLVTENTPDTSDTFWEHVGDVADVAALAGGVIASGVILVGSGGTATPLVAGAWAVALGSAGYMGVKAAAELHDRHDHGQTLSLSDPDARAAWLSLAGSGLTVVGAGAMRGATALASQGAKLAPQAARAAGILNATANLADAAGTVDQAHGLVTNWDRMTPAQRAQVGLSIAFWGGMTGVSAKASGGRVTDAFSFRAQMNSALIESGAAVRPNSNMAAGHARVRTGYGESGKLDLRVEYGPGTSDISVRIHKEVARALIDNSGVQGAIRRSLGDGTAYRPGSRGEEVALEVAKHEALVKAFDAEIPRAPASERAELKVERDAYAAALTEHRADLEGLAARPRAAQAPGLGHVDAVSARSVNRLRTYVSDAKSRAVSPEAEARIEALEARLAKVAANFEANKVPADSNTINNLLRILAEVDHLSTAAPSPRRSTARPPTESFGALTTRPEVAREAAARFPELYQRYRGMSEHLFSGKRGRAEVLAAVQKLARAEALHQARAALRPPGSAAPLQLEPGAPARTHIDPSVDYPMGFSSRADFDGFGQDLLQHIRKADAGASLILEGSSLTGRRYERSVDFDYTGAPFDVGRISDYDVAIVSEAIAHRAKQLGITVTDRGLKRTEMKRLGLVELYDAAQAAALQRTGIAHDVNFKVFASADAAGKGPSLTMVGPD